MRSGDVVRVDFGIPIGSEPGFVRPAVLVMADAFLRFRPSTVYVVPLTSTTRTFPSHVDIEADDRNGLTVDSCALVEQLRAVAIERCDPCGGNVGPTVVNQILDIVAMITGMP